MTTQTSDQGLVIPDYPEQADGPLDFYQFATGGLESRLVKRYANATDRTTRNPTPQANEFSVRADAPGILEYWSGSAWVSTSSYALSVYKTADESVPNSVALQNDDHLFLPVVNGAVYTFELVVYVTGAGSATAGDFTHAWTFPGGTLYYGAQGLTNSVAYGVSTTGSVNALTFINNTSPSSAMSHGTPLTNITPIFGRGLYVCTANGTLQLQWCQRAVSATPTTVKTGSHLLAHRIA